MNDREESQVFQSWELRQVLDLLAQRPERHAEMDFCHCPQDWCCICGGPLDHTASHVSLAVEHHSPSYTVPGRSGPVTAHASCWDTLIYQAAETMQARKMRLSPETQA